jgi:glycosyltransferase involved in cell wall biosynthesis
LTEIGMAERDVAVIYDGVEAEPLPGDGAEFRRRSGLREDALLLGTLTSIAPEKLLREQLELLAELPPTVHLWMARPASEQKAAQELALLSYATELGLEDRFRIVPSENDLGGFLKALDIFLYLSKAEGLGSAILLAMAHQLPVVASQVGGIPEIVRHGETGLLAGEDLKKELPRAVNELLASSALRSRLGQAGRAFVLKNATVDVMAARTSALYEKLLGGSAEPLLERVESGESNGRNTSAAKGGRG